MGNATDSTAPDWLRLLAGRFIVFDGPDGSGKSTQLRRMATLFKEHEAALGFELCEVREPGGTHVGEQIRTALLEHSDEEMSLSCEMLLYMASRAQLVQQRIMPALERKGFVLADRFVSSTLAYQGTAGGLPPDDIMAVARIATGGLEPDLVVIFDVDEQTASGRLNPLMDRIEARGSAFHRRVREGYLDQARREPGKHLVVDASCDEDGVWDRLVIGLRERLG